VVDELGLDETAVGGEDEGYVPCLEEAAAGPADDSDAVAVFGEDEGYVPDGTGAASAPADDSDSLAVFGQGTGFVAKPCVEVTPDIRTQKVFFTEWGAYTIQNDLIYGDVVFGPGVGQPGHEFRGYGAIVAEPDEVQSLAAIFIYDTGDAAVIRNISYRISNLYLAITAGPDSGAALPGAIFPVPFTVYMGEGYDQFTPPTNDLTPGPGSAAIGGGSILSQSPTTYLLPDITINTDAHIFRFYIRMDNEIYIPGPRRITMVTLNPVGSPAFIERTFEVLP
jgi:hypothetical protein